MKLILTICLFALVAVSVQSQEVPEYQLILKKEYLQKSKTQKVLAMVFLGGTVGIFGYWLTEPPLDQWGTLFISGGASLTVAILLSRSSARNKRKASKLDQSMDLRRSDLITPKGNDVYPALTFKMTF